MQDDLISPLDAALSGARRGFEAEGSGSEGIGQRQSPTCAAVFDANRCGGSRARSRWNGALELHGGTVTLLSHLARKGQLEDAVAIVVSEPKA